MPAVGFQEAVFKPEADHQAAAHDLAGPPEAFSVQAHCALRRLGDLHINELSCKEQCAHKSEFACVGGVQGRFSFYMTSGGEEATAVGTAAALQPDDVVIMNIFTLIVHWSIANS